MLGWLKKKRVGHWIKEIIKKSCGFDSKEARPPLKYLYFWNNINQAFPFTYVDVGAMDGISCKWDSIRSRMKILGFELDEREFLRLQSSPNLTYLNTALFNCNQCKIA